MNVTQYGKRLLHNGLCEVIKERTIRYNEEIYCRCTPQIVDVMNRLYECNRRTEEHIWIACFNTKCRLIGTFEASVGSVNSSMVPVREILQQALMMNAVYIAAIHNHPSGDCSPSDEDITSMRKLSQGASAIGISLIDSVIISQNDYNSFHDYVKGVIER